jgi:hypothetical protein
MIGAEFAQKIADMGYGGRTLDIGAENGADDIVRITSHGLTNNNDLGSLTTAHGGVSFHGDAAGFGVDNAPESGGRWINTADSIDFAVQSWMGQNQAIKTFSFTVDVNGTGSRNLLIDFDGNVAVETNPLQNVQLVGAMATRTQQDAFLLGAFNDGDTVTLNFDAKTLTVNGVTSALSAAITDAFEAAGVDNVTIGAERTDGLGFSLANVAIGTVDSFLDDGAGGLETADTLSLVWLSQAAGPWNSNSAWLWTTLTESGGSPENLVLASRNSGGTMADTMSGPDDTVLGRIVLDNAHLSMTAFGEFRTAVANDFADGFGHMVGEFFGGPGPSSGIAVDTANGAANPDDGSPRNTRNYGGPSSGHMENGEFIRFDLGGGRSAGKAEFALNFVSDTNDTVETDVVVRLFLDGELIETIFADLDEDGALAVDDNLGQAFDRVEIGTVARSGVAMRIVDADFWLV